MQTGTLSELQIILVVTAPLPGVVFAVQHGRDGLLSPYASTPDRLSFALTLSLGPALPDGSFNYRGPFAQGTPADRFIYLNSGTYAGQPDTPWARRAKIRLAGMPGDLVAAATGDADRAIEACLHGMARDGGPVCASVAPALIQWRLVGHP
ncbi:DUF5990 family protein [Hydrogenophaga laconesensis]|uniref:Uncharacterized protein n=1 Tax=Hydrogenophaga laconesensis TaxID=1805971 RepID=A0ABU1VID6_9BURK|nr:DUF5990 family protein [Hydrogenophaga laconesensis]MDR7097240.1 hypothetical protein [Hydrogenophaga laconesensis]